MLLALEIRLQTHGFSLKDFMHVIISICINNLLCPADYLYVFSSGLSSSNSAVLNVKLINLLLVILQNDWSVVKRGWDAQVLGEAPYKFKSALDAVKTLRQDPKANDQYLPPFVIVGEDGKAVGPIVDGDAVVTVNFRADRMTMLAKALEYKNFDNFDRVRFPKIRYAGMLQYDGELKLPNAILVLPQR